MPPAPAHDSPQHGQLPAARWRVRLLGGLSLDDGRQRLNRLPSRAVTLLLARLAMHPERAHARESLVDMLWPDADLATGLRRLRHTLSILRSLLEPDGGVASPVLDADRLAVRVVAGALSSDAAAFEQACRAGRAAEARGLYGGELLPGFYEDWVDEERQRLAALHEALDERDDSQPSATGRAAESRESDRGRRGDAASAAGASAPSAPGLPPTRSTLPLYLTRRFGADDELARLIDTVAAHRLVTILGPGGSGKTRLAVEAAQAFQRGDGNGPAFDLVAFVSLVGSTTRVQAIDALAATLQIAAVGDHEAEAVVAALAGRRALLVLDNLEQLVGIVDELIARLVGTLPTLHVLATSRRPLGADGEREFALAALAVPTADATRADAAQNAAVALFVDRARAVRGDFHLGPGNAEALVGLVRALEGMPLAIELAASRVRSFSPQAMLERLLGPGRPHLELLERSGRRGALDPRHASMQRTIAWSVGLLSPVERDLLGALAVFPGSFDAAGVEGLVVGETSFAPGLPSADDSAAPPAAAPAIVLDGLVAASLVRVLVGDDEGVASPRFALYQPIREDALDRLGDAGRRHWRDRHRRWLRQRVLALSPGARLDAVRALVPDLLAALTSALDDEAPADALALALAWAPWFDDVPVPADGLAHVEAAIDRVDDEAARGRARVVLTSALFVAGQPEAALRHAEAALASTALDREWRVRALHARALLHWRSRREATRALAWLDDAEAAAGGGVGPRLRADLLVLRASIVGKGTGNGLGDHAAAERMHEAALALRESAGDAQGAMRSRYHLAADAQAAGRHRVALERLGTLVDETRRLRHDHLASRVHNARGNARSELGDWHGAVADYRVSIRLAWQLAAPFDLAYPLWNLPRALAHLRRPVLAAQVAAHSARFWQTRFGELAKGDLHDLRRLRRLVLAQIAPAEFDAACRAGEAMPLGDLVAATLVDDPAGVRQPASV